MSELNPDPGAATADPDCLDALNALAAKLPLAAVLSGRGVRDLESHVGLEGVWYGGNHGAEYIRDGVYEVVPGANAARASLESVLEHVKNRAADPAFIWEDKGFSISVHYRGAADAILAKKELQAGIDSAPHMESLEVFWGNHILEVRGRTGLNKGHAVRKLVDEFSLDSAVFIGDDTTDIDGMRAVSEMRVAGEIDAVGIAVARPESPAELIEFADYTVSNVGEVAKFMRWLVSVA
ncbi:MAG: trehalose-phosphatase [Chloroflexi bacterium]|nr:trehalose-phosphatase [Chloroflexota bacterium]